MAIIATGATFGLLGAGTALAKFDPSFRTTVEQNVPYSQQTLKLILGSPSPATPPSPAAKPILRSAVTTGTQKSPASADAPGSLLQKKLDREAKSDPVQSATSPKTTAALTAVPAPVLEKPIESPAGSKSPATDSKKPDADKKITPDSSSSISSESNPPEGLNKHSGLSSEFPFKNDPKPADASSTSSRDFDLNSLPDNVRDKVNQEMREQLKLQLSAYNDYLHDQLRLQQDELSRMHGIEMEERVLEEKMRYQRELAGSIVRLQDVEQVLQGEYNLFWNFIDFDVTSSL